MSEARILIVEGAGLAHASLLLRILEQESLIVPARSQGKTEKLRALAESLERAPTIFYEPRTRRAQWKDELHRPHGRRR